MTSRALWLLCLCATPAFAASSLTAEEILVRVRATYGALDRYADTGTVLIESRPIGATIIRERYTFVTRYARPKRFYFDARRDTGERFVVWCPGDTFNSWWSATRVHEQYAQGEGANAFAVGSLPTAGSILLIAPLLFQSAGLQGPLVTMEQPRLIGVETLEGRRTYRLEAAIRMNHWNDSVRATRVWIDAETFLISKVFEDTPSGLGGAIQQTTTVFAASTEVALEAKSFRFDP